MLTLLLNERGINQMRNETGEAIFCEGCPMAGIFCGEVLPESVKVDQIKPQRVTAEHDTIVYLEDVDGLKSGVVRHEYNSSYNPAGSRASDAEAAEAKEQDDQFVGYYSSDEGKQAIVERIARCTGTTSFGIHRGISISCRALNAEALLSIAKNNMEI